MHEAIPVDAEPSVEVDASTSHPSCVGYAFTEKPPDTPPPPPTPPPPKEKCKEFI